MSSAKKQELLLRLTPGSKGKYILPSTSAQKTARVPGHLKEIICWLKFEYHKSLENQKKSNYTAQEITWLSMFEPRSLSET